MLNYDLYICIYYLIKMKAVAYLNSQIWLDDTTQILFQHGVVQRSQMSLYNNIILQFLGVFQKGGLKIS